MAQLRKRKAGQEPATEKAAAADTKPKRQRLPLRAKAGEELPATEKGTLITFDDDKVNQDVKVVSAPTIVAPKVEDLAANNDDDDDAAPEVISTVKAATELKLSEQAAQKAVRRQAAAEKQKRRERDSLLKKQAAERKRVARDQPDAAIVPPQDDGQDETSNIPTVSSGKRQPGRVAVPDVLPMELLDESSSEDDEEQVKTRRRTDVSKQPEKRTIANVEGRLTRLDTAPRDKVVKSTVYRVAAKADERLVPKAGERSLNIRERLLRRKRMPATDHMLLTRK
ncbi:hypothetical protein CDD80_6519 [Ophiocordyceps camponoti-rufipedis]|uniref:Uncharacterized protein n=1 Tax=Ophiocordyceps camponoti-rufipedis TaxID=2004952 RepID=A0A2C5YJS2_9HYPO|nr:hypothetical protein CDD80_6519 [Ophiocordyceps camponoti-rufipedis]